MAKAAAPHDAKSEQDLMMQLWAPARTDDLYAFVMFAYPWGEKGTPLEHHKGPRKWQKDVLDQISAHIKRQRARGTPADPYEVFRMAVASGRGIGKSALVAWIAHWHITTRPGSTTLVSANTEPQLHSTTFPEIKKWFILAINSHWFEYNALSIVPADWYAKAVEKQLKKSCAYYSVQAKLWAEENPDAYAGPHSEIGMLLLFDEASGIPTSIANVAGGYFVDVRNPCRLWLAFSNPRRNSGFFYDCFHERDANGKLSWVTRQIDSRTVEDTDQAEHESRIRRRGIDSDEVRIEVLGQFPKQGKNQFIGNELVRDAEQRELITDPGAPLIMGVDVAREGDDETVVRFRQGPDARSIPPIRWKIPDLYVTADRLAALITEYNPDAVCIDLGMGAGVIDILKRKNFKTHGIGFGQKADDPQWANKRTELYARLREWLRGGCIDAGGTLFGDLTAADYDFHGKGKDAIILEPKERFKSRLGRSPDDGDALALTFAVTVARRDRMTSRGATRRNRIAAGVDYPLFG
jgi:hypothetical protein